MTSTRRHWLTVSPQSAERDRNSGAALPSALPDAGYQKLKAHLNSKAARSQALRARWRGEPAPAPTSAPQQRTASRAKPATVAGMVRLARLDQLEPAGFRRIASGFYRKGHDVWELRRDGDRGDGYVLVRKREERLVDLRGPGGLGTAAAVAAGIVRTAQLGELGPDVEPADFGPEGAELDPADVPDEGELLPGVPVDDPVDDAEELYDVHEVLHGREPHYDPANPLVEAAQEAAGEASGGPGGTANPRDVSGTPGNEARRRRVYRGQAYPDLEGLYDDGGGERDPEAWDAWIDQPDEGDAPGEEGLQVWEIADASGAALDSFQTETEAEEAAADYEAAGQEVVVRPRPLEPGELTDPADVIGETVDAHDGAAPVAAVLEALQHVLWGHGQAGGNEGDSAEVLHDALAAGTFAVTDGPDGDEVITRAGADAGAGSEHLAAFALEAQGWKDWAAGAALATGLAGAAGPAAAGPTDVYQPGGAPDPVQRTQNVKWQPSSGHGPGYADQLQALKAEQAQLLATYKGDPKLQQAFMAGYRAAHAAALGGAEGGDAIATARAQALGTGQAMQNAGTAFDAGVKYGQNALELQRLGKGASVARQAVCPPGKKMKRLVKELEDNPDVDNPYAVAWSEYDKEHDKRSDVDLEGKCGRRRQLRKGLRVLAIRKGGVAEGVIVEAIPLSEILRGAPAAVDFGEGAEPIGADEMLEPEIDLEGFELEPLDAEGEADEADDDGEADDDTLELDEPVIGLDGETDELDLDLEEPDADDGAEAEPRVLVIRVGDVL